MVVVDVVVDVVFIGVAVALTVDNHCWCIMAVKVISVGTLWLSSCTHRWQYVPIVIIVYLSLVFICPPSQ